MLCQIVSIGANVTEWRTGNHRARDCPRTLPVTPLPLISAFAARLGRAALVFTMFSLAACGSSDKGKKVGAPAQLPVPNATTTAPPEDGSGVPGDFSTTVPGASSETAALPPGVPPAPGATLPDAADGRLVLTPPPGVVAVTPVALLVPLSGPHAALGAALLNAAQLALFDLADESFALLPVDTQGTAEGARAAIATAINAGARLVLGPVFSAAVAGAAPAARAGGLQVVAFTNDTAVAGDGVYVMGFTPETQIGRIVGFAAKRGIRRIAAIVPSGPFGIRVEEALRLAAETSGAEVGDIARYHATTTEALGPVVRALAEYDTRRQAMQARKAELEGRTDEASRRALKRLELRETVGDVAFDSVLLPEGGAVLRALAPLLPFYEIDPRRVKVLGTVQWDDPVLATEPALFGSWFPSPPPPRKAFEAHYRKTYRKLPPRLASLAYDATALATVLMRTAKEIEDAETAAVASAEGTPPPLPPSNPFTAERLTATNGFAGIDGIFRLLPSGLVQRGLAVMEVRRRRFKVISPAPRTFERPPS
jgi:hypothetical protein